MTATGAFLVFAAAAVFVAVSWDHIPDALKLAALCLMSGGCLLVGRARRQSLPATSAVLYHLGAFLIPVVSAAVVVHEGASWSTAVLVEGAVATVAFWWLNRRERSVVLDWATAAAVVVLAVGIAAVTPVPAPVMLVAFAAVAAIVGRSRYAISWAIVAGLAPIGSLAASALGFGTGVLVQLGLTTTEPRLAAVAVGAVSAAVLGREAGRRRDLLLVVLAGLAAFTGLTDGWTALVHSPYAHLVGLAALFVVIEALAMARTEDPFWGRPTAGLAGLVEVLAGVGLWLIADVVGFVIAVAIWRDPAEPWSRASNPGAVLGAAALGVVGWFLADLRRRQSDRTPMGIALLVGGGWMPATVAMTATVMIAVAAGLASPIALGVAALVVAALLVVSGRPGAHVLAVLLAVPAPLGALHHPVLAAALALVAGIILAAVAVIRAPLARTLADEQNVWMLAVSTVLPLVSAWVAARPVALLPALVTAVLIAWACGLVLEGAEVDHNPVLSGVALAPRAAALLTLLAIPALTAAGVAALTSLLGGLALLDAIARRRPLMAIQTALLTPVALAAGLTALGIPRPVAALSVVMIAVGATAIDVVVPDGWRVSLRLAAVSATATALVLGAADRPTLATLMIVIGAMAILWAARFEVIEVTAMGALLMTGGTWVHLVDHAVRAAEPYLAPVALAMLVAGEMARRRTRISSWVAFGPPVAMFGGVALAERLAGGGAGHALVAGLVGLVAVAVGGQRRLIAPLLVGTALLVALTIHETLAVTAGVPTWAWLGLGGSILIAAGVTMERADRGPLETGRRLVDVIDERFT